jgi:hypothetical protein
LLTFNAFSRIKESCLRYKTCNGASKSLSKSSIYFLIFSFFIIFIFLKFIYILFYHKLLHYLCFHQVMVLQERILLEPKEKKIRLVSYLSTIKVQKKYCIANLISFLSKALNTYSFVNRRS